MPTRAEEIKQALDRARDQTLELEARKAALEELRETGAIDDLLEETDTETTESIDVDEELQALKDELRDES